MSKMNPEAKAAWLEALRSDRYRQGRGRLCRVDTQGNAFCCLGVLTDIAVRNGTGLWHEEYGGAGQPGTVVARSWGDAKGSYRESMQLPQGVIDWAFPEEREAYDYSPTVLYRGWERTLTRLNDLEKLTFTEIADLVEEQF